MEKSVKCRKCGAENSPDARYCPQCGSALGSGSHRKRKTGSPKPSWSAENKKKPVPVGNSSGMKIIKAGALFFFLMLVYLSLPEKNRYGNQRSAGNIRPPVLTEQKSDDPRLEASVLDIASKFICSCGTCGEQPLELCTCEVAVAERRFIRNELRAQKDPVSIIRMVNEKYGWIKPRFADKYGTGKSRPRLEKRLPGVTGLSILADKTEMVPASRADRSAIISSFSCTCGQCEIEALKDCECSHPGGAQEVKAFIDLKIGEGKYTRENIVEIVDARYGNRIR